MAARIEPAQAKRVPHLVDLRQLCAADLEDLLEEEVCAWREQLDWDFSKSADLVRRFVDMQALHGCALLDGGMVIGYAYLVIEELKGLIGDVYVRHAYRGAGNDRRLLSQMIGSLAAAGKINRIESQLLMVDADLSNVGPSDAFVRMFPRNFMMLEMGAGPPPESSHRQLPQNIYLEKWSEHHQDAAAQLIAAAYLDHIDGQINDQYRSVAGARRFLFNIVQYPGCGAFFRPASLAAFDIQTGRMWGICLASLVAPDCGHITQICVLPEARGLGVGYELMSHSLKVLREFGCQRASLTVTAANPAVRLYQRMGFRSKRRFAAYVWEGF